MEVTAKGGGGGDLGLMERLPQSMLLEILGKLDLESLCSASVVSRPFRVLVGQTLSSITALDLSAFAPNIEILHRILKDNQVIRRLAIDCRHLDDSSVNVFAKESLLELSLLKGDLFTSKVISAIGEMSPNLRLFMVEMNANASASVKDCEQNVKKLQHKCLKLQILRIRFIGFDINPEDIEILGLFPPRRMKALLLQPISERRTKLLIDKVAALRNPSGSTSKLGSSFYPEQGFIQLQSLILVLDQITDDLLLSIVQNLHLLTELGLYDTPSAEPFLQHDLTNSGLQTLGSCRHLTHLSLARSSHVVTFRRVNDMGMFLLSDGCKNLETIRLGGFSQVTDAGFVSLLHSCKKLKNFEVFKSPLMSDLAFYNLNDLSSLVHVKLMSCSKLTSEAAKSLTLCGRLEVLNLSSCGSIGDSGLCSISNLRLLSTLDLGGANITDSGLSVLGDSGSPITSLSLRNCNRITDEGITSLLHGRGILSKSLLTLDLGYVPGISDTSMYTVAEVCRGIENLCLRYCDSITDSSIAVLGSIQESSKRRPLRRLDLFHCNGLSADVIQLLCRPYFRGLRWLGIRPTQVITKDKYAVSGDRPWIIVCVYGCELNCKDKWHTHDEFL